MQFVQLKFKHKRNCTLTISIDKIIIIMSTLELYWSNIEQKQQQYNIGINSNIWTLSPAWMWNVDHVWNSVQTVCHSQSHKQRSLRSQVPSGPMRINTFILKIVITFIKLNMHSTCASNKGSASIIETFTCVHVNKIYRIMWVLYYVDLLSLTFQISIENDKHIKWIGQL